jgi:16S rRNA (cytidine1402-2'-O)-methyltransferase
LLAELAGDKIPVMGTLFLVATPIGNLEDMSPRGVRILREAHLIAAEDTRHTRQLLTHFDIHTALISYFEHNKLARLEAILSALSQGDVALVSDAGTPAINDPGFELVKSALASGLPTDSFLYLGYLPRKTSERKILFERVGEFPYTLIFLESPHRVLESLADMQTFLGDREVTAARELTKIYEQFVRGRISQVRAHFTQNEPRGEFVLVVGGHVEMRSEKWPENKLLAAIDRSILAGKKAREISIELAIESGWNKKEIYALLHQDR